MRRRIRASREQLDVIRRAINLAEAEDWLRLPYRSDIRNRLSAAAYLRTRIGLAERRAPRRAEPTRSGRQGRGA